MRFRMYEEAPDFRPVPVAVVELTSGEHHKQGLTLIHFSAQPKPRPPV